MLMHAAKLHDGRAGKIKATMLLMFSKQARCWSPISTWSWLAACLAVVFYPGHTAFAQVVAGDAAEDGPIRGVVRPIERAAVSTDLNAPVRLIKFREGERFQSNDLLVAFDCSRDYGALKAAQATEDEMQLNYKSNRHLKRHGAGGNIELEISRVRLDRAKGEADVLRAKTRQCEFRAPFSGRVVELFVNTHERPSPDKPFIQIINDTKLEIEVIVPSPWLKWLSHGERFNFYIDELGQSFAMRVERIGAVVDAVSQTIKVIAVFSEPTEHVLAGMSGSAVFKKPEG